MKFLKVLQKMQRKDLLTGQLFFRLLNFGKNVGRTNLLEQDLCDRELFSIVGNIAVPKGLCQDEYQYAVGGFKSEKNGVIISLDQVNGISFEEQFRGSGLNQILKEPIWRI